MMKHDIYSLKDFLRNLNQIIVPEIQRDYVWGEDNVKRFLQSIFDSSKRQKDKLPELPEELLRGLSPDDRECLLRSRKERENNNNCQIGFIYAYPATSEMSDDRYILIDGQQRMTTLFLILLALSVKEKKTDSFKRNYFKNDVLKLDYKVRETSREFLRKFVPYILAGKSIADISDEYWNFAEYKNDATIQSIIANYQVIGDFIDTHDLPLNYVEERVEFWYYDTSKSDQGEKLYLYMNSRGETVSPNESIKANLLKGLTTQEKHDWGTRWEEWQNLFWRYRNGNPNADKGIDEFLRWIKFIELTKSEREQPKSTLAKRIETIKKSGKIDLAGLSLGIIERYYNALKRLITLKDESKFNLCWLAGYCNTQKHDIPAIDYIKLIPMLMYVEKHPNSDAVAVKRFARFFLNITRFETIEKSPYDFIVEVIRLTNCFLEKEFTDIASITVLADNYKTILSDEEVGKLEIYKQNSDELRPQIEAAFWEAEDFFCNGKIWLIWDCINYVPSGVCSCFDSQKISEFKDCFENIKILFDKPTDLIRRALLTKGDYLIRDGYSTIRVGYSTSLILPRYSFINEEQRWKERLSSKEGIMPYKLLIKDFGERKKTADSTDAILNQIIADYLNAMVGGGDWRYYFVKDPSLLEYCRQKMICGKGENGIGKIALLESNKVMENKWNLLEKMTEL